MTIPIFCADVDNPPRFAWQPELPPMLTAQELVDWVVLSRVRGTVVRYHGEYFDGGAPMPRYLIPELLFDVLVRAKTTKVHDCSMGKHSKVRHRNQPAARRGMVKMMGIRTGDHHLLTPDAAAAVRQPPNRYLALCGAEVIPAALVDAGKGRYC